MLIGGSDFVQNVLEVKLKGNYSYFFHSQFQKHGNECLPLESGSISTDI